MTHPSQMNLPSARRSLVAGSLLVALASSGCSMGLQRPVSPAEIPALEAELSRSPDDGGTLHRYAAALFAADRCEEAVSVASRAMDVDPESYLGPLVQGRCLEADGQFDAALAVYGRFLEEHSGVTGVEAVDAQRRLAVQERAIMAARVALDEEAQGIAPGPADPDAVAVLPVLVQGNPEYAPLSRGLASLMISDLDLLQRFTLVERIETQAIIDELALAQSDRVDPATAARVGRIIRAGQTVQGSVTLNADGEDTALQAAVVGAAGDTPDVVTFAGGLGSLLDLEKDLVLSVSSSLGYEPSLAERTRILENGTRSLAAFLAYSSGLESDAAGDYAAAATYFREALNQDPNFEQARSALAGSAAMNIAVNAPRTQLTVVGSDSEVGVARALGGASPAAGGTTSAALQNSIVDVAGLDAEIATASAGEPDASRAIRDLTGGPTGDPPPPAVSQTGQIRIFFVIP